MIDNTSECRWYGGLASYQDFLSNDPHYSERTKWNRIIRASGQKCRPYSVRQDRWFLYVAHETEHELLATRLAVDLEPATDPLEDGWIADLRRRGLLAYRRHMLQQQPQNSEVTERLKAILFFRAKPAELSSLVSLLGIEAHGPVRPKSGWLHPSEIAWGSTLPSWA